ncbi:kinase-like protein [Athelia psychrophila]|uniref:Kinase-like protein n=1 Tax=Athelia psychrophila TaxID=1759441 RepID=A0A166E0A8_9AGAM|nr:kinase-like protein [Fibularhizoctonia sp. CBS 109695]
MYVRQSPYVVTILTPGRLPWQSHPPVAPPMNGRNMKLSDLAIVHKIGEGSCAKVFQVRDRVTDRTFALKVIRKKNLHPEDLEATLLEQKILLANTGSSHLLSLDASFHDTMNFYFVVPYTPLGDLHSEIEKSGTLSASRARFFMAELLLGLNALQVLGVIHRDIKPANLLIGATGHLVIADFGLARSFAAQPERAVRHCTTLPLGPYQTQSSCGTWPFMSPELIRGRPYSFEGDIWAAGVTLYVMLCGRIPWGGCLNADDRHLICKAPLRFNHHPHVDGVSRDFLKGVLAKRPSQRMMSMSEIKSHKYFDGLDWAAVSAGVCPVPEARVSLLERRAPPTARKLAIAMGNPLDNDPYADFNFCSPRMVPVAPAENADHQKSAGGDTSKCKRASVWRKAKAKLMPRTIVV